MLIGREQRAPKMLFGKEECIAPSTRNVTAVHGRNSSLLSWPQINGSVEVRCLP